MARSLILGAVLGGIVAFAWSFVSWSFLPLHKSSMRGFTDEGSVAAALSASTPASGIYFYPSGEAAPGASAAEKQAAMTAAEAKMRAGPMIFVSIYKAGMASIAPLMVKGLFIYMFGAFLMTWLLLRAQGLSYLGRVGFVVIASLVAWVLADLPDWNWWSFSTSYTLAALVDLVVGWFLAGLVIARFATVAGR
jgi:hypothetical protein